MPSYRAPKKNEPTFHSLREQAPAAEMTEMQAAYLGAFVEHVLALQMAIYVAALQNGAGVRVRVFNGDDKYEDSLLFSEEWLPVLTAYCKPLGGGQEWLLRAGRVNARFPQEPPGAAKGGKG